MARPRLSAKILEFRGAFVAHPERKREDLKGSGPWDATPPKSLRANERRAWKEIAAALPQVALTATERVGVEQMARIYAALKRLPPTSSDFHKLDSAFRQWAIQMGMTLAARAKLGTNAKQAGRSRFAALKGEA